MSLLIITALAACGDSHQMEDAGVDSDAARPDLRMPDFGRDGGDGVFSLELEVEWRDETGPAPDWLLVSSSCGERREGRLDAASLVLELSADCAPYHFTAAAEGHGAATVQGVRGPQVVRLELGAGTRVEPVEGDHLLTVTVTGVQDDERWQPISAALAGWEPTDTGATIDLDSARDTGLHLLVTERGPSFYYSEPRELDIPFDGKAPLRMVAVLESGEGLPGTVEIDAGAGVTPIAQPLRVHVTSDRAVAFVSGTALMRIDPERYVTYPVGAESLTLDETEVSGSVWTFPDGPWGTTERTTLELRDDRGSLLYELRTGRTSGEIELPPVPPAIELSGTSLADIGFVANGSGWDGLVLIVTQDAAPVQWVTLVPQHSGPGEWTAELPDALALESLGFDPAELYSVVAYLVSDLWDDGPLRATFASPPWVASSVRALRDLTGP